LATRVPSGTKKSAVARHHGAHAGFGIDLGAQAPGNLQRHVLFVAAAAPDGARILAAMPGIEHDGDQAAHVGFSRPVRRVRFDVPPGSLLSSLRRRLFLRCTGRRVRFIRRTVSLVNHVTLARELHQRVERLQRVDVHHQPMAVLPDRRQREYLRLHLGLQLDDQPHHARLVAAGADELDVGVGVRNLARQRAEHIVQFETFEIDDQTFRILDQKMRGLQLGAGLQRDAGIFQRRPDTHGKQR
jgi:hypothetical protein